MQRFVRDGGLPGSLDNMLLLEHVAFKAACLRRMMRGSRGDGDWLSPPSIASGLGDARISARAATLLGYRAGSCRLSPSATASS